MESNGSQTSIGLVERDNESGAGAGSVQAGTAVPFSESGGEEKERKGFGLWSYLFVCFGIVAAVPVLILGINEAHRWRTVQLEAIDREGRFVAEALALVISEHVKIHVGGIESLAAQVQAMGTFDPSVVRPLIVSQKAHLGNYSFLYIAGRNARSIITDPPFDGEGQPTDGMDYSDRAYVRELMKTGKTSISGVEIGKRTHRPAIHIGTPIRDRSGKITGFIGSALDMDAIQGAVGQIIKGVSGLQAAVIDDDGRVIAHPNETYRDSMKNLSGLPLFQTNPDPDVTFRSGKDDHGIMMRAAVAGIRTHNLNWTVVVYRPESLIEEQAAEARSQAILVAAVALLAGLVFATLLVTGLTRPIRRLAAITTAVGRGNFSDFPSLPGAWMPGEMVALQIALRKMVLQLRSYTKELELRVKERTAQLNDKNRELESFVYTVSHDLKTPVVSLHGMASVLFEDYSDKLDDQGKHYLRRVVANASFMEQLIEDLLTLSRTGRRAQKPELVDTGRLVQEVLIQCQEMIQKRGVSVKIHSPLPEAVFDPIPLRQVFMNLVTNGIKFLGAQPAPSIEIGGSRGEGYVEYFVKDNGIGIEPRYHELVFGIFQRLREVEVEGTGVGLAIVKKIIDSARGKIWIESEKGKGASFFFRIPSQEPLTEMES